MLPIRMEQKALDTAVRKFASTVAAYNATQVEYDKNVKARVKGVLKTVLNKSDAELDEVIESGQSIEAIRGVRLVDMASCVGDDGQCERDHQDERASSGGDVPVRAEHPAIHGAAEPDVYGFGIFGQRAGRVHRSH